MLARILIGLIGAALSVLLIVYRVRVREFMGQMAWAEQKIGPGGTYTVLVIVGIVGFFLSLAYMTNSFGFILGGAGERLFDSAQS